MKSSSFTSFTEKRLVFTSAGSDLNFDPIAIGKIGKTTVYKYTYDFPKEYTGSTVITAYADMNCTAFYDASGELIPYNLTCEVTNDMSRQQIVANVWLHIYGTPTRIMVSAGGGNTVNISNISIVLHYIGIGETTVQV